MKGYFSRLVKHSGLHFSELRGDAPAGAGTHASPLPAPLGIEETVFAPPIDEAERVPSSPGRKLERNTQMPEQQMPKVSPRHRQASAIHENVPARGVERVDLKHVRKEMRMDSFAPVEREMITQAIGEANPPAKSKSAGESRILGQPASAEAGVMDAHVLDGSVRARESQALAIEPEPFETVAAKRHFAKTAEVIEQGNLGAEEIQNIVFQEVRAWAAASPAGGDLRDIHLEETSESIPRQRSVRAVPERGAGTMRAENGMEKTESAQPSGVEEQSWNLAIGTISVVIEDVEKPVQQSEQRRQDLGSQSTRQESGRQFSRLSRNYL